jgi:hypothetical protein
LCIVFSPPGDAAATKSNENHAAQPSGKPRQQNSTRRSQAKTPQYAKMGGKSGLQGESGNRNDSFLDSAMSKQRSPSATSEKDDSELDSIATISPAPRKEKNGVKLPIIKMQALGIFSSSGKHSSRSSRKSTRMKNKLPNVKTKPGLKSATQTLRDNFRQNGGNNLNSKQNDNFSVHSCDDDVTEGSNLFLTDRSSACADNFENMRITPAKTSPFDSELKEVPLVDQENFEDAEDNIDGIVMRLTQALPPKLMANAHENANRLLYGRRKMMTEISRRESCRNTMEDPRWRKLVESLVNNT